MCFRIADQDKVFLRPYLDVNVQPANTVVGNKMMFRFLVEVARVFHG